MLSHILAIISIISILIFSYLKRQLTFRAIIAGLVVGMILYYCGGWLFLIVLYTFFISSVIISNIKKTYKNAVTAKIQEKNNIRDCTQVFANSGLALIFALIYHFSKDQIYEIIVLILFACHNADTWASELGLLSKENPVFIVGFKKAQKGISGAITLTGIVGSFLGSFIIAILYLTFKGDIKNTFLISIFGFIGALIDSILGQFLQALYYDDKLNQFSEKKYSGNRMNRKIKGCSMITNDVVNILAPFISVLLYLCYLFISQ